MKISTGQAIPGPDAACMDAAVTLVDGFIKDCNLWPNTHDRNELVRRVGTLLDEWRADKKRLDWLSNRGYACFGVNCQAGRRLVQLETGGYAECGSTLREAIDAAMLKGADRGVRQ